MYRKYLYTVILVILTYSTCFGSSASNRKYDIYFYKWTKTYLGINYDWKRLKAQAIQESALRPDAVSPVGAMGVMQAMPGTWKEQTAKMNISADAFDPYWNIAVGAYYMSYLWRNWKAKRTFDDRWALCLASYNGGLGNVLKAQKICIKLNEPGANCNSWYDIQKHAYDVNTWKCEESLTYVERIFNIYEKLK